MFNVVKVELTIGNVSELWRLHSASVDDVRGIRVQPDDHDQLLRELSGEQMT